MPNPPFDDRDGQIWWDGALTFPLFLGMLTDFSAETCMRLFG